MYTKFEIECDNCRESYHIVIKESSEQEPSFCSFCGTTFDTINEDLIEDNDE